MGHSIGMPGVDADRVLGRDVADDERLSVQAALDELAPVAALQCRVGNRFDDHRSNVGIQDNLSASHGGI